MRGLVLSLCVIACALTAPTAALAGEPRHFDITVEQASVEDPGHPSIQVSIWAPAVGSRFPLVVISHGNGGFQDSHADTARALAHAGFVVVAPTHPGDNYRDVRSSGQPQWIVDRARHVTRVIDFMYGVWDGRRRLIPDRVGIFGFSAGATTALVAIGGEPDLDGVPDHCAKHREVICTLMAPPAKGLAPKWSADQRIVAAVVAAPGLGFAFAPSGLKKITAPVQLWSGDEDHNVPYATNTAVVRKLLPQAPEVHSVPGAVHFSFLRPCGPETPSVFCQDSPGFDRVAFHQTFNAAVIGFFQRHLGEGVGAAR